MKNWVTLFILIINSNFVFSQLTTQNFTINDFEYSIRSDGKVFSTDDNGVGLRYKGDNESLHEGIGLVGYGPNISGNLHSCGHIVDYSNPSFSKFTSGLRNSTTSALEMDQIYDQFYTIDRNDILKHIQDYEDNLVIDNPISDIFTWPGKNNEYYSDTISYDTPAAFAPFFDVNGNNKYEPQLGEYPNIDDQSIWDMPISNIVLKYFTSDSLYNSTAQPLLLNGLVMIYGFDCSIDDLDLTNYLFVQHIITSIGITDYLDFKLGIDHNFAFGDSGNDYLSYDTVDNTIICYNDPLIPDTYSRTQGKVLSTFLLGGLYEYTLFNGNIPPIFHTPQYFNHYDTDTTLATSGPTNDEQFYDNTLSGLWKDGTVKTPSAYGYNGLTGETYPYSFDGYIGSTDGWNESIEGNNSGKRNALHIFPPIKLQPQSVNSLTHIFHVSDTVEGLPDYSQNHINRIEIQSFLQGSSAFNCYPNTATTDSGVDIEISLFPNPSENQFCIRSNYIIKKVDLYNELGQLVQSRIYNHIDIVLDINVPGIYFAHITTGQGTHVEKLVKI